MSILKNTQENEQNQQTFYHHFRDKTAPTTEPFYCLLKTYKGNNNNNNNSQVCSKYV